MRYVIYYYYLAFYLQFFFIFLLILGIKLVFDDFYFGGFLYIILVSYYSYLLGI